MEKLQPENFSDKQTEKSSFGDLANYGGKPSLPQEKVIREDARLCPVRWTFHRVSVDCFRVEEKVFFVCLSKNVCGSMDLREDARVVSL